MESLQSVTLRSLLISTLAGPISKLSDIESPPVFNQIERPEIETEEGKAFELFLRDNSRNSRDRKVVWLFVCVYQWRKLYLELQAGWFKILFSNTDIAVK